MYIPYIPWRWAWGRSVGRLIRVSGGHHESKGGSNCILGRGTLSEGIIVWRGATLSSQLHSTWTVISTQRNTATEDTPRRLGRRDWRFELNLSVEWPVLIMSRIFRDTRVKRYLPRSCHIRLRQFVSLWVKFYGYVVILVGIIERIGSTRIGWRPVRLHRTRRFFKRIHV